MQSVMSPYTLSKMHGESLCRMFVENDDFRLMVVRPSFVYGFVPQQDDLISKWLQFALADDELHIAGDGETIRNYVYVEDVASAVLKMLETSAIGTKLMINPEDINQMNYFDLINLPIVSPMDVSSILKGTKNGIESYFRLENAEGISSYGLKNLGKFIIFPDKIHPSYNMNTRIHIDINTRPRTTGSDGESVELGNNNSSIPEIYTTIRSNFGKHFIAGISYFKSLGEPHFNDPATMFFHNREIKVFGGDQLRPNIHINDMVDSYLAVLDAPSKKINGEVFNVGFKNQSVNELANDVKEVIGSDVNIIHTKSDDNRSYHVSSEKIKEMLGFETKYTVKDAVLDLKNAFEKKLLTNTFNDEFFFNIKRMNNINLR